MDRNIKVNGNKIKNMALVFILGQIEVNSRVNIKMD